MDPRKSLWDKELAFSSPHTHLSNMQYLTGIHKTMLTVRANARRTQRRGGRPPANLNRWGPGRSTAQSHTAGPDTDPPSHSWPGGGSQGEG